MIVGLTGSIGMGKSTTAAMFADRGVPVWDADAAVHRLYADGGAAVAAFKMVMPSVIEDNAVSRPKLKAWIASDDDALGQIEAIVHPLVAEDRLNFLQEHGGELVILDIPLLFETGSEQRVDKIIVVSASEDIQRARVLARGTMTDTEFDAILAKQLPDEEKRGRADYVIETTSFEDAEKQVTDVLEELRGEIDA